MSAPYKPTPDEIRAAAGKTVRDVIAPNLRVLFCGINPGLYTAAVGHHFARPGNRFWPALYAAGITPRLFSPFEEQALLPLGYGITNVVQRASIGRQPETIGETALWVLPNPSGLNAHYQPEALARLLAELRVAFAG